MNRKTFGRIVLAVAMAAALGINLAGCGSNVEGEYAFQFDGYPIQDNVQLTYWLELNGNLPENVTSLEDTPFGQKLQQDTGVDINFLHPRRGMEEEEFNLLLASGDLPDLISYDWYHISGGPESAISGGHILPLGELIAQEAPNLSAYLQAHPDIDKMIQTDEGHYYVFPFLRGDESLGVYEGLMLRDDWLRELGLQVPETIEEWTQVLRAFRDQKGATVPFANGGTEVFAGAFGVSGGYYLEQGKIQYGPLQPGYAAYLQQMRQWYEEGLLDKTLATLSDAEIVEKMYRGQSGATYGLLSSSMGRMITHMQQEGKAFSLTAAPFPAQQKGMTPEFGVLDYPYTPKRSVAISTACKEPRLAARFLDYGYGEAGKTLYNFGIEGQSFTQEGDTKAYTEEILHNTQGLSPSAALSYYACSAYSGPFVQDREHLNMFYTLPVQQEAVRIWANNNGAAHRVPYICATASESYEIGTIDNEVARYTDEMTVKFIMGIEPLENFGTFQQGLRDRGIDRAIEIRQNQYERYLAR